MITKEQIILCINNFINYIYQVDIIRSYCLEKNKSEIDTEIFLQLLRDKALIENRDYFSIIAAYVIERKIQELNLIRVLDSNNKVLLIY